MQDAIYKAFGFGCHCRNCEYAERRHNGGFGGWKCKLGFLREIRHASFCSEGRPREEKGKEDKHED